MKRIQESGFLKAVSVILMLALSFMAAFNCFRLLESLPYTGMESEQETSRFYDLIRERQDRIASCCATWLILEEDEMLSYAQRQILEDELERSVQEYSAESTWFRFQLKTADGTQILCSNLEEGEVLENLVERVHYACFIPGEHHVTTVHTISWDGSKEAVSAQMLPEEAVAAEELIGKNQLVLECGVPSGDVLRQDKSEAVRIDDFTWLAWDYQAAQDGSQNEMYWVISCSAAVMLLFLYLLWGAGHKSGEDGVITGWQEKIFIELYFCLAAAIVSGGVIMMIYLVDRSILYGYLGRWSRSEILAAAFGVLTAGCVGVTTLFLRTLVVRLKAGMLGHTCLVCRAVISMRQMICELVQSLPFLWKVIITFVTFFFANSMLFHAGRNSALMGLLWFVLNAAVLLVLCWWALGFRRLQQGGEAMAEGNVEYQVDTRMLPGGLRKHAENLNNLSQGLAAAVDERIKSERFKAELITNVSHDLKTPLTSIINYVNLLKGTEQTDQKALEYIEVLDRKSQRLKKLTEDLVEASKASTGVLNVNRERISAGQLVDQAVGEWSEKLAARGLSVVIGQPEGETWVYADGRHLWRVLDNLLSNCSKYAMEGTRVYIDLIRGKGQVVLSVKNISREPLNVPAERLMERFVRGEESRSSEGSGLGLSIARSLTELQGGVFELTVDGDLFKAVLILPQAT